MDVLVTYDIRTATRAGERRLVKVAKICEAYGERVQYSVFECRLTAQGYERLVTELLEVIRADDTVRLYRVPGRLSTTREVLGTRRDREVGDPWIL
jgi:CRISPR-associated protein Cas2